MTVFEIALVLVLTLAGSASAREVVKHSGVIVDADEKVGTFVLAEVGPWQTRTGATVVTRRTIVFTRDTEFAGDDRSLIEWGNREDLPVATDRRAGGGGGS